MEEKDIIITPYLGLRKRKYKASYKFKRNGKTIEAYEDGSTKKSAVSKLKRLLGIA